MVNLLSTIQEIKPLNLIPIFGLFFYNILQLKNVARIRDLFFLLIFLLIHIVNIINIENFHINILCIEFIFIIFWFKFPKKTNFYHFIVLFLFSILIIFLDNFNLLNLFHVTQKYQIKNFNYIILYNIIIYIFHLFFFQKKIFISSNFYLKIFLLYFFIIFSNLTQILFLNKELSKYIIFSIFLYTFYIYLFYKNYINSRNFQFLQNKIYIYIILLIIFFNYQIIISFEKDNCLRLNDFFILNFLILFKINFKKENTFLNKGIKINYLSFLILNLNLFISHFYVFFLSLRIKSSLLNYSAIGIILFSIYCLFKYIKVFRKFHKKSILEKKSIFIFDKDNFDLLSILLFLLNFVLFYFINKDFISKIYFKNLYLLHFDKRIIFFIILILIAYKSKNIFYKIISYFLTIWNFILRAVKITISSFYISFMEYIFLLKIKSNKIAKIFVSMNLENRILNINNIIFISILFILGLTILNSFFE